MMPPLKRILCVDDEEDILAVSKLALECVGKFEVYTLSNSTRAVEEAASIAPDLILLDVMMPVMDGPATLRALRQNKMLDSVPIIFMTARVQPKEVEEYIVLGASGVIPKPFDPMRVSEEISQLWKRFHDER